MRRTLRLALLLIGAPAFCAATWSALLVLLGGAGIDAAVDAWWFVYGFAALYCIAVLLPSARLHRPRAVGDWMRMGIQHAVLAFLLASFVFLQPFQGALPFRAFVDIGFLILAGAVPIGVLSGDVCRRLWKKVARS